MRARGVIRLENISSWNTDDYRRRMQSSRIGRNRLLTGPCWSVIGNRHENELENNDRHGIATGSNGNFDGTHTDKRRKLQCTTGRNWFYGDDGSRRGAFGTGPGEFL